MTKRQQIFDILNRDGYISDTQTVKIFGDESGICKIGEYVRQWRALQRDKAYFEGKKIVEKTRIGRWHAVRTDGFFEGINYIRYQKVSKQFYDSIIL